MKFHSGFKKPPSESHRGMPHTSLTRRSRSAFTLLEVMIACGIFFVAIFTILALVSNTLRNARGLRRVELDAGMVAAQLAMTNRLSEGAESGDFGDLYPDYTWQREIRGHEVFTNGLVVVDIIVYRRGQREPADALSIWVFDPNFQKHP
jgi:type II secretory pathway pseudopilin PulG